MKIKLVTVGKLKEKYLKDGIAEYAKRLSRFSKLEIVELADEKTPDKASELENQQILEKEGSRILAKVSEREFMVALAIEGKQFPSEEFSSILSDITVRGFSDITFVIGGSLGLSNELIQRADFRWRISKATFPHQLCRILVVEQIYRSFRILHNEPYHK